MKVAFSWAVAPCILVDYQQGDLIALMIEAASTFETAVHFY
jgi:hypothetical protein